MHKRIGFVMQENMLFTETKDARQASAELGSMGDAGRVQDKGER